MDIAIGGCMPETWGLVGADGDSEVNGSYMIQTVRRPGRLDFRLTEDGRYMGMFPNRQEAKAFAESEYSRKPDRF
jgi:hypothetical protein